MSTFYVDLENGNDANDGTSFANRWLTLTSGATAARIAPGDVIRIMGSPAATSLGQSVTWTNQSATLTLSTAVTKTISDCDSSWTASANVTASNPTFAQKQGTANLQLAIAAGFTTGKLAYKALGASTDFSGHKQVTFWWRSNTVHAGTVFTVRLCSDTTGDTTVNTIAVPAIQTGVTNQWIPVTVDTGAALGAAIQSVAIYAESDPGTITVQIDNLEACKDSASADSLTLRSLVSKNADDGYGGLLWWPIRSILGTTVILETNWTNSTLSANSGYYGTTASVTTYKRETIRLTSTSGVLKLNDSGTSGSPITYSGGWNRTDMSSQDGMTFVDNRDVPQNNTAATSGFYAGSNTYVNLSKVRVVGGDVQFGFGSSAHYVLDDIQAIIPGEYGISFGSASNLIPDVSQLTNAYVIGGQTYPIVSDITLNSATPGIAFSVWVYSSRFSPCTLLNLDTCTGEFHFYNCLQSPQIALKWSELAILEVRDGAPLSLLNCADSTIDTLIVSGSTSTSCILLTGGSIVAAPSNVAQANLVINQLTLTASGSVSAFNGLHETSADIFVRASTLSGGGTITPGGPGAISGRISWANYNGTAGDHRIYTGLVTVTSDTTTRHTASGNSWKVLGGNNQATAAYPVKLPLGNIYCLANQAVTISVWMYRTSTSFGAALAIPKGRIPGAVADARTAMTAAINTWEQVTITFTPTADCIVPVRLEFGPVVLNESVYFDDLQVSQSGTAPDFKTLDFAGLSGRPFLGPAAQSFAASSGGGLLSQRGFTGGLPG
jgi:hypothetical protein